MLKRFQENDEIADLPGIQPELRHARMTGDDPFAERFLERLDWISQVKRSEWRRNDKGTLSELVNGMAMRSANALPAETLGSALHGIATVNTLKAMATVKPWLGMICRARILVS